MTRPRDGQLKLANAEISFVQIFGVMHKVRATSLTSGALTPLSLSRKSVSSSEKCLAPSINDFQSSPSFTIQLRRDTVWKIST
jgi:hypothetical protein